MKSSLALLACFFGLALASSDAAVPACKIVRIILFLSPSLPVEAAMELDTDVSSQTLHASLPVHRTSARREPRVAPPSVAAAFVKRFDAGHLLDLLPTFTHARSYALSSSS
ncbi:hypothetical protein PCL_10063 [Purpureocillium lilacinum]|uniref:Uncharacterized protein n=1 Tax=Purpureocillium lilacinum TaxID=33203 RepID=A0A2U3EEV8_PURLI|nr:hypothetical protein PCL_10063 [Purpureocillium lilacinum]